MDIEFERRIKDLVSSGEGYTGLVIRSLKENDLNLSFNVDRIFPSASVIKLPIACVAFHQNATGILDLGRQVRLTEKMVVGGSGALQYLRPDLLLRLEDALVLSLIMSDNVATNTLIDEVGGMEALNGHWLCWGLTATRINRYMMDFDARGAEIDNWISAHEMAFLLEKLYRGQLLPPNQTSRLLEILAGQQVNHKLPDQWPEGVWFAHKTGELPVGIEHDVGVLKTKRGVYVVVALTSNYPSNYQALQHIRKIGSLIRNFLIE